MGSCRGFLWKSAWNHRSKIFSQVLALLRQYSFIVCKPRSHFSPSFHSFARKFHLFPRLFFAFVSIVFCSIETKRSSSHPGVVNHLVRSDPGWIIVQHFSLHSDSLILVAHSTLARKEYRSTVERSPNPVAVNSGSVLRARLHTGGRNVISWPVRSAVDSPQ